MSRSSILLNRFFVFENIKVDRFHWNSAFRRAFTGNITNENLGFLLNVTEKKYQIIFC